MEKLSALRARFHSEWDAALILSPVNRRYYTGFASSEGALVITRDRAVFLTDGRYLEGARRQIQDMEVLDIAASSGHLQTVFTQLGAITVALEAEFTTLYKLMQLQQVCEAVYFDGSGDLDRILLGQREIKTPAEIQKIQQAQDIAESAYRKLLDWVHIGKTEREVARYLDFQMLEAGAERIAFETIAVSGCNSALPHGVPTDRPLQAGDFLTLDFGAVCDGYHSDMTRTIAFGHITPEQKSVYETVLAANAAAAATIRAGVSAQAVDAAARRVIEQAGFGEAFLHSVGHGVGLEIHEAPRLNAKSAAQLLPGMVVTVEPGIYLEGAYGVRIEDMLLVTESGSENFAQTPKGLLIL